MALISPGLGVANRGFEASVLRWYKAIEKQEGLATSLLCGGSVADGQKVLCARRDGPTVRLLRRLGLAHDGCRIEQISFGLALVPKLLRSRPDVLWLQEASLGRLLLRVRKVTGLRFKVVFCNGAPVDPASCVDFDHVHQLHQVGMREAREAGIPEERLTELPYCREIPDVRESKAQLRKRYGIPEGAFVVVSVAAINTHHKRIDYLIEEVAKAEGDVFLALCGQAEPGSESLFELAEKRLGDRYTHLLVKPEEVSGIVSAADLFVLASLSEGLPGVLIEAALCKAPIVCHRYPGSEEILGQDYPFTDLSVADGLAHAVATHRTKPTEPGELRRIFERVAERFGSDALSKRFVDMLWKAHDAPANARR